MSRRTYRYDDEFDLGDDQIALGEIQTQVRIQDDAKVVSGHLELVGDYPAIREGLTRGLEEFAAKVTELGGIVGHIKASVRHSQVEMFSVTDVEAMIKTAPEEQVTITLAAIVFFITEEQAETLARQALAQAGGHL